MKQVIITGGSGLLGLKIAKLLLQNNYEPLLLTRKENPAIPHRQFIWNPKQRIIDERIFDQSTAIIHLAGASVAGGRWTKAYKDEIISSRIDSARLLYDTMQRLQKKIDVFISASASGYYPADTNTLLDESMDPAHTFLGNTCKQWEAAADRFTTLATRVVKLRLGIVLSRDGGALDAIYKTMPFGVAGIFGNGRQIYPWIHIDDVARMFLCALREPLTGAYNAVAPEKTTYLDIISAIEKVRGHKTIHLPAPKFVLRIILGEFADSLYASQHISSKRISDAGFRFQYAVLREAMQQLFQN